MIKIRLHGTLNEIKQATDTLDKVFDIQSQSEPYKDRGQSKYYRVYVDCENKEREE